MSLNPRIDVISPRDATTVPPGTPGAAIAKIPSKTIKTIMLEVSGSFPYIICETVITKKTSVKTEPHK